MHLKIKEETELNISTFFNIKWRELLDYLPKLHDEVHE